MLYIRNKFYDWNIFKSTKFKFPIISVGNLAMGGVGKTPHIEYLIRLLKNNYTVATLSRGYKRNTSGFLLSDKNSMVTDIGDEPLQYKMKFTAIFVAVDEKRVNGVNQLKLNHPEINLVLLDDAYQHRAISPGFNILITEYKKLYVNDTVIPSGRLREWNSGSCRADIIIVSKTKNNLSGSEKEKIKIELNALPHQKIYFSYIKYGELIPFTIVAKKLTEKIDKNYSVLLLSGIANPVPLFNAISKKYKTVEHLKFSDHHNFNDSDILQIKKNYKKLAENNKIIISTEKDIMRLSLPEILNQLQDIPIFYIPIEICFHGDDKKEFDTQILEYVTKN